MLGVAFFIVMLSVIMLSVEAPCQTDPKLPCLVKLANNKSLGGPKVGFIEKIAIYVEASLL